MPESVPVLCESCGYDLSGSERDGLCGECGAPVSESLPEQRPGSAWQRGGGPVCLVRTAALVARQPRGIWGTVRVDFVGSLGLLLANAAVAGLLFGITTDRLIGIPAFALGIVVLSMIEFVGLRIFGKRRGWRVSPEVAMTVVGHASAAWMLAAVLCGVGFRIGQSTDGGLPLPQAIWSIAGRSSIDWSVVLPVAGFLGGMLAFEVLVYIGVRRCRFANPPTATL